ncbi:MAG: hypothetical protein AAFO91_07150, partial [Bacteroidota bacterium]
MSAEPGQTWQSSVKVINSNSFPITIYPEAVNFESRNESGHGKFVPVLQKATEGTTLAEWITLTDLESVTIQPERSREIPFSVSVPDDASP